MADYRAIAGVSSTLSALLADRMRVPVDVTVAPPDVTLAATSAKRVNLYLYQVTENEHLKNHDLTAHPGSPGRPPLSLVLHYLVTAHSASETSNTADLEAQQILGDAMQVLHDIPVVTTGLRRERDGGGPVLDSSLRGEYEHLKITLKPLSLDDQSRLWSALPKGAFRRSVAYEASVVQIESRLPRTTSPPVETRRLQAGVLHRPEIARAYRTPPSPDDPRGDPRVPVLGSLTLDGHNFVAPRTWVRFGKLEPIRVVAGRDDRLEIAVPDDEYPADPDHAATRPIPAEDRLQPGPRVVRVVTERRADVVAGGLGRGESSDGVMLQLSGDAVFMLVPTLNSRSPASGPDGTVLRVNGRRLIHPDLECSVLVGDRTFAPLPAGTAGQPATVPNETQVRVEVRGLTAGTYPVRVRVNGAESLQTLSFQVT